MGTQKAGKHYSRSLYRLWRVRISQPTVARSIASNMFYYMIPSIYLRKLGIFKRRTFTGSFAS